MIAGEEDVPARYFDTLSQAKKFTSSRKEVDIDKIREGGVYTEIEPTQHGLPSTCKLFKKLNGTYKIVVGPGRMFTSLNLAKEVRYTHWMERL